MELVYEWRSKVKAKQNNAKVAKFREEQREAAELDPRRAAALGAILSLNNAKKDGLESGELETAAGDAEAAPAGGTAFKSKILTTNQSAMTFLDIVKEVRGKEDAKFDKGDFVFQIDGSLTLIPTGSKMR